MNTFPFPGHDLILPDIIRAENCSLFDSKGKRYVDLEAGVWCTSIGHGHPAVKAAVARQMGDISHTGFCYSSPVVEKAAGTVLNLLDHEGGRCSFLCSGSESVEYGVRTMRTALPDRVFMAMSDSYFGAYGDAASKGGEGWYVFDWFECEGCKRPACTNECPRWMSIPFEDIGAFLFEPGSSSGLVRFPPAKLIMRIADTIQENDGLVMINEVTTGIGRTGKWFGYQHYDLKPDIVALGKGVGNGYPVSCTSLGPRVLELIDGVPFPYGQSHLNDPTGAAVVEAIVSHIAENGLIERGSGLSEILLGGLEAIAAASPHVVTVRGRGLMAVIEFGQDPDFSRTRRLHRRLVREGFVVVIRPNSSMLRMDPALTMEEQDLQAFLDALKRLLADF